MVEIEKINADDFTIFECHTDQPGTMAKVLLRLHLVKLQSSNADSEILASEKSQPSKVQLTNSFL